MILAEKIIDERKKNGWSQEDLADKLGVSRQSVSKWEGAQSVPDLQRILEMSELFGVSTDYLLKDEETNRTDDIEDSGTTSRKLSMEEANEFLDHNKVFAKKIAVGSMICTLCPVPLMILMAFQNAGKIGLTEDQTGAIGIAVLLAIVALALVFIIPAAMNASKWEWLENEVFDPEYGVEGMVRSRSDKYGKSFVNSITFGTVSILLGVIALITGAAIDEKNEPLLMGLTGVMLVFIAVGVLLIVNAGIIKDGFSKLLQEESYSRTEKTNKALKTVAPVFWMIVTAGYLLWSFLTNDWHITWIVWPVAGVIYGAISVILRNTHKDS
ncbi:MAG: helix-turn-helix transcriptional regulator [Clostridiales bacterium]|nr:helix-turn-helix transcriptional regulator [Clostridiales bacterium]